jgi:hypothetical protein
VEEWHAVQDSTVDIPWQEQDLTAGELGGNNATAG